MRLIDADTLESKVLEWMPPNPCGVEEKEYPIETDMVASFLMAIDEAPTIEQPTWVPCSERLPEDDELMLVTYVDPRPEAMDIWIGWHEMENVWYIDGEAHSNEYGNEVIAWMPLPKPWKGADK